MVDHFTKEIRSKIMASVRSRGNKTTELKMATILRENRLSGWRRHISVSGTPDFAWPKLKVALFVDGCFWHGCPRCYQEPTSNIAYWRDKVLNNKRRDQRTNSKLRSKGWSVIHVWECKLEMPNVIVRISKILEKRQAKLNLDDK